MDSGIYRFFDGRYIDLPEIIEISPVTVQGTDSLDAQLASTIRLEFAIHFRGEAGSRVYSFDIDSILGKDSIENETRIHFAEHGPRQLVRMVLAPRALELLTKHVDELAGAWKASRSAGASAASILDLLEAKAADQRAYFDRKQKSLPGIEDYFDEDGYLELPQDIGPLLEDRAAHGRFCEADWWLSSIRELRKATLRPTVEVTRTSEGRLRGPHGRQGVLAR